jgi:hypothetical protein|tara:strand:- start:369 stop:545 length:177 start_codon:yes stop_codon:yes gene_type:complete
MANKKYKWFLTKRNRMMKKNNSVITDDNDFHNHMKKEKEILDISMKESIRQKEERTKS